MEEPGELYRVEFLAMPLPIVIVTETLIVCLLACVQLSNFLVDKFVLYCTSNNVNFVEVLQTIVGRCDGQLSHDSMFSWNFELSLSITPSRSIRQILRCDN
ncbi:hypothetical protein T11_10049 [Trichinella zimbabwensis]|uniref:Uncharacterized protein n=1 Tax=Trichinella zimbabwensis TaxID=268475 RepID=A0A0V1GU70_9BILA|nr:hypothetical protein T11_10049 [Trichinella zimbabwensis]